MSIAAITCNWSDARSPKASVTSSSCESSPKTKRAATTAKVSTAPIMFGIVHSVVSPARRRLVRRLSSSASLAVNRCRPRRLFFDFKLALLSRSLAVSLSLSVGGASPSRRSKRAFLVEERAMVVLRAGRLARYRILISSGRARRPRSRLHAFLQSNGRELSSSAAAASFPRTDASGAPCRGWQQGASRTWCQGSGLRAWTAFALYYSHLYARA